MLVSSLGFESRHFNTADSASEARAVSSSTLKLSQYKSNTPPIVIGVTLIVLAVLGVVYSFVPASTKHSEIDLGTKLQTLGPQVQVRMPSEDASFRLVNRVQAPSPEKGRLQPQKFECSITGIPETLVEGPTTLKVSYFCDGQIVETPKARWTINAGKFAERGPSVLELDTTGLAGKRIVLSAIWAGCGRALCERNFVVLVVQRKGGRIVVNVGDAAGKPITGATVTLKGPTGQAIEKDSGSQGQAIFSDLPPGPYAIIVTAAGYVTLQTSRELTTDTLTLTAKLSFSGEPSPSPSPSPSISPSPSVSPSVSPSTASVTPTAPPTPAQTNESHSVSVFAPGKNGKLTVAWPNKILPGWPNLCESRYEPQPASSVPDGYDLQAAFFLTSPSGIANEALSSSYQRLDGSTHVWSIPLEPAADTGTPVSATLMMRVRQESSTTDVELQPLQSTVAAPLLTRNETWTASAMSALLGVGFLGIGRGKGLDLNLTWAGPFRGISAINVRLEDVAGMIKERLRAMAPSRSDATKSADTVSDSAAGTVVSGTTELIPDESPRYTDVTFYEGHLYPSDNLAEATKVPDDVPLVADNPYTLEVAIRSQRTGVASDLPPKREVENPRENQETLTIHVIATSLRGFKIVEPLATIKWPYDQDSESALFRLDIDRDLDSDRPGSIEIRILDESLNLLDVVSLKVALVADVYDTADIPMRQLDWKNKNSEGLTLAGTSKPRLTSIRVRPVTNGFSFDFVFYSGSGKLVSISVVRSISTNDLSALLAKVRNFWTHLVVNTYSRKLTVSRTTYDSYLKELRGYGMEAWSLLFNIRTSNQEGASERIGQIIASADEKLTEVTSLLQSNDDKTIQISYADDTGDFIFPWSILHPPTAPDEPVDPLRFWGARYRIEQVMNDGPKRDRIDERPINILFALDPTFGDAPSQKKMFADYQSANQSELQISAPISDQKMLASYLIRDPSVHLLYFYCHGYAATRPGMIMADGVQALQHYIEEIRKQANDDDSATADAQANDDDSATADALEKLLELTSKMAGESWIYLGDAEVKESDLTLLKFFAKRRPIVFLNMCQSADLAPSLSSGLVRLFIKRDASAVVGTESPMTSLFADAFSRRVLDALLGGDNIGTALWKARRHFLIERNPLGLAYTLYGRADANLCNEEKPLYRSSPNNQEKI